MESATTVLSAQSLAKIYRFDAVVVEALRGVDLDLHESELLVLLGPSGSGKSTLLNILGGLDLPTSGEVCYRAQNLTQASDAELTAYRRHHVGFVFQFYNLIPSLTARENVSLLVAAFVLNVALTRAVSLQRPQIATLKAIGYDNAALAWHYLKWAALIAVGGIALGVTAGAWLGSLIIEIYNQFFRFPVLDYRLSVGVTIAAAALSLASVSIGAWTAVRRAVRIPPAEAMRPETPPRYRRSLIEQPLFRRLFSTAGRMVLRNLERQPVRAITSILGAASALAILVVGFTFIESTNQLIDLQFDVAQRQDVTLTFVEPRSAAAAHALARLPGVLQIEPVRVVPARFRAGPRHRTVSIVGMSAAPRWDCRRTWRSAGCTG